MSWQINYAIELLTKSISSLAAQHVGGDAIRVSMPGRPDTIAVVSADYTITQALATQYHQNIPEMEFLCGYRKECVWEGGAISYLEANAIGWGSAGTLGSAVNSGNLRGATHKDYFFAYRLISQIKSIEHLDREFDRVLKATMKNGRTIRIGMIMAYEPTADAVRTMWDRFGPIDVAWNINPNGSPTASAIDAARALGCRVMKWDELGPLLRASK